jgi:hypothetical protein
MNPRVKSVVVRDDYKLEITFTNGEAIHRRGEGR